MRDFRLGPEGYRAGSAALSSQAPHPHAAVLFVDFLFSPDGQKILEAFDYGSPAKEFGFNAGKRTGQMGAGIGEMGEIET